MAQRKRKKSKVRKKLKKKKVKKKVKKKSKIKVKKKAKIKVKNVVAEIKLDSPEFIALQSKWYEKLKKSNFEDIEWFDAKTGKGQDNPHMKRPVSTLRLSYNVDVENHYRLCRNYVTHGMFRSERERFIFASYTNGHSYRRIVEELAENLFDPISVYTVHKLVAKLKEEMIEFNRNHIEGMLNESNQDLILDDFSIKKDKGLINEKK